MKESYILGFPSCSDGKANLSGVEPEPQPEPQEPELLALAKPEPECILDPGPHLDPDLT